MRNHPQPISLPLYGNGTIPVTPESTPRLQKQIRLCTNQRARSRNDAIYVLRRARSESAISFAAPRMARKSPRMRHGPKASLKYPLEPVRRKSPSTIAACIILAPRELNNRTKPAPWYMPTPPGVMTMYRIVALMALERIGVTPGIGRQNTLIMAICLTGSLVFGDRRGIV